MILANKSFKDYYSKYLQEDFTVNSNISSIKKNHLFITSIQNMYKRQSKSSLIIQPTANQWLQLHSIYLDISKYQESIGLIIEVQDITVFIEFDNSRKAFVSSISHELRTPLTAILLSVQNLERYKSKLSEEEQMVLVRIILQRTALLNQMVDDLLIYSKIESKKLILKWEMFNLKAIIEEVIAQLEPKQILKEIVLEMEIDPKIQIYGDIIRISQIFRILLDNAIKYSPNNAVVEVKAIEHYLGKFNPNKLEGVLIQVIDFGIGIKENDLKNLFQRFYRSEDVRDIQGTGLGLSIAKELVLLHHGEIFVESQYGKGSTFSVFLPKININL
jgi:signal transduction histidine kinase